MAELTNAEFEKARDNAATRQQLTHDTARLEGDVKNWMSQAVALHTASHTTDKASILAMRDVLIAKLTAAVKI